MVSMFLRFFKNRFIDKSLFFVARREGTFFFCLIFGVGVGLGTSMKMNPPQIGVVAAHSILGDWVREVAGPGVSVRVFVGPSADAHTYQPSPDDVRLLADAQVLVFSGVHFEPWLPDLIRSSRTKARMIDLSNAVSLRRLAGPHGEIDPHYWNDVRNAQSAIPGRRGGGPAFQRHVRLGVGLDGPVAIVSRPVPHVVWQHPGGLVIGPLGHGRGGNGFGRGPPPFQ
ncbi:MAG: zinc ABC transporter substrate-binding protein [Elusimicrobia bacterium]|nr:zinc ABC transporter substrate-binding protein [Elusimicrobiota bacterium]